MNIFDVLEVLKAPADIAGMGRFIIHLWKEHEQNSG